MRPVQFLLAAASALLAMTLASAAEPVAVLSASFQGDFEFKVPDGPQLHATLKLPEGKAPFPLVVILHGGTGVGALETQDVAELTSRGYATAIVDSFSGRGYKPEQGTGAGASLRPLVRVPDAYAALNVLTTDPMIDGKRTALFGRSHGGATVMIAATTWAKLKYGAASPGFRLFIALYPVCSITYPEFMSLTAPLRLHLGLKDDLTPASACESVAKQMQSQGQDAKSTVYADAYHGFDLSTPVSYFGQWLNYGSCNLQLASIEEAPPQDQVRRCVRRGTSIGGNPKAQALFRQNMADELSEALK